CFVSICSCKSDSVFFFFFFFFQAEDGIRDFHVTGVQTCALPIFVTLRNDHINRFIWAANANAKRLLGEGYKPPATGSKELNPFWWGLTSQLTNEIWGVIYPGMTKKAAKWSEWGARVKNDDWATHPTKFYGALYSAAFFEKDINKLIEIGMREIPEDSPYIAGIKDDNKWSTEHEN